MPRPPRCCARSTGRGRRRSGACRRPGCAGCCGNTTSVTGPPGACPRAGSSIASRPRPPSARPARFRLVYSGAPGIDSTFSRMAHPFLNPAFAIRWSTLTAEHIGPDIERALVGAQAAIDATAGRDLGALTYEDTFLVLEGATEE